MVKQHEMPFYVLQFNTINKKTVCCVRICFNWFQFQRLAMARSIRHIFSLNCKSSSVFKYYYIFSLLFTSLLFSFKPAGVNVFKKSQNANRFCWKPARATMRKRVWSIKSTCLPIGKRWVLASSLWCSESSHSKMPLSAFRHKSLLLQYYNLYVLENHVLNAQSH